MPIYEYRCPSCGQLSEVLVQGFFSPGNPRCPGCGHEMERRLTVASVVKEKVGHSGNTCCGREERCETPSCSTGKGCRRH